MQTLDYITLHDNDDPLYIYIERVCIFGNWWAVYILLVDCTELICKAKGDFTPKRQLNTSPILRFDSGVSIPVFPGISLEGEG